jgi:hypothetical protein
MAARGDNEMLFAIDAVSHGRCITTCWKLRLPELLSGFDVKSTLKGKKIVVAGVI